MRKVSVHTRRFRSVRCPRLPENKVFEVCPVLLAMSTSLHVRTASFSVREMGNMVLIKVEIDLFVRVLASNSSNLSYTCQSHIPNLGISMIVRRV